MTKPIRADFDGRVIVPDEPIDIPVDVPMEVRVTLMDADPVASAEARRRVIDRMVSRVIPGINLPAAALSHESIYGND